MRKLLVVTFTSLIAIGLTAQQQTHIKFPFDSLLKKISFEDTVHLNGKTKDQIIGILKNWFRKNTTSDINVKNPSRFLFLTTSSPEIFFMTKQTDGFTTHGISSFSLKNEPSSCTDIQMQFSLLFIISNNELIYRVNYFYYQGCQRNTKEMNEMILPDELENILVVKDNREYYDKILLCIRTRSEAIIHSFLSAVKRNKAF